MIDIDPPGSGSLIHKADYFGILSALFLAHGIETWAPIGQDALTDGIYSSPTTRQAPCVDNQAPGIGMARGAVTVAFPYDPRPFHPPKETDLPGGAEPYLRIGAFAAAHRYAALARILKSVARRLAAATGHPYTNFRVAVNSRLPEKHLAELAGLGHRGRSDLLLSHAYGPACILGVLLLPFDPLDANPAGYVAKGSCGSGWEASCKSCHACADACPSGAITGPVDNGSGSGSGSSSDAGRNGDGKGVSVQQTYCREACIQHWMSTLEDPPRALLPAFSGHLYGCDACILACPHAARAWLPDREAGSSPASRAEALLLQAERRPGNLVSASFLKKAGDDELRTFFRKTALGLSWLGTGMIRRNADLAGHDCGIVRHAEI